MRDNDQPRRRPTPPISRARSVYEWTALVLTGFPALVGPWLFGAVRVWSVAPLILFALAGATLTLLRPVFFPGTEAFRVPRGWFIFVAFALYGAVRAGSAAVPYEAWFEVCRIASYAAVWWTWTELAGRGQRWRILLGLFLLSATCMAWYALVQHSHGSRMVLMVARPEVYGMRASGAYICPNHFANLLEMTAAVGLALACCSSAGALLRMLGGYAAIICLPPLYLTQSRSGWISAAVGLTVAWCVMAWRKSTRTFAVSLVAAPLLVAAAGAAVWSLSPMVQARVADALQGNVRIALWKDTLGMIRDNPAWGHGPGSYRWVFPHFKRHLTAYLDPQFAHNDYLHTLAEYGAVGATLAGAAAMIALFSLLARARKCERERDAALIAGCAGALAASCAHAMFDYNLQIFANVHVLLFFAGLAASSLSWSGQPEPDALPRGAAVSLRVAGLVLAAVVAVVSAQAMASYLLARSGDAFREQLDYEPARGRYASAIRFDPRNWKPYLGMGHLLRLQANWNRDPETRPGQIADARSFYEQTLARNVWQTEASYGLGKLALMEGNDARALATAEELVRKVPYHRFYLTELGLRLREAGRYREALDRFIEAQAMGTTEMIDLNIALLREKIAAEGNVTPQGSR
ncbi:MAG TPA: O-antigen ligase family protein [Kiritimatiellia bacterium]